MRTTYRAHQQVDQGIVALRRYVSEFEEVENEQQQPQLQLIDSKRHGRNHKQKPDAIYISTKEGRLINVNQPLSDLLGYSQEDMLGMDVRDIFSSPAELDMLLQEIDHKGYAISNRMRMLKKDGGEVVCLVTSTVRWYNDDNIPGNQPMLKSWVRSAS